jgi:hypothetical protein
VGGGSEDPDPTGGVLDHHEDVHPRSADRDRLQEVTGEQGIGLRPQEVRPGAGRPLGCRIDTGLAQDLPDRGRSDPHTQHEKFAVRTSVAPAGVLSRQAQHQDADGPQCAWPAGTLGSGGAGVATGEEVAVPA